MASTHHLYYRLCLAQGLCLAVGFWIFFQLQRPTIESAVEARQAGQAVAVTDSARRLQVRATTVSLIGTWALLCGVTGILLLREQRQQLLALLAKHDTPPLPVAEPLVQPGPTSREPLEDENDRRRSRPQLRLAIHDDDEPEVEADFLALSHEH